MDNVSVATENEQFIGDENYYGRILNVAVEIGSAILSYGGSVSRVETAVERICAAYGAKEVNVFAIPSMIIAGVELADGTEISQMKRVYSISNNLAMLEKYNQLSRDICKNKYDLKTLFEQFNKVKQSKPSNKYITLLGGALVSGAFNVYFGGGLIDFIPALLIGTLMTYLNGVFSAKAFNSYARTFTLSVIGGTLAIFLCWLLSLIGIQCHTDMVMIGTIMIVVPGLLICNAVRDLFTGDLLSGTLQILNGVLVTLAIAAGYGVAMFIFKDIMVNANGPLRDLFPFNFGYYYYVIPFCMVGAFGVALWFNLSFKRMGWAMLNTLITFIVFLVMQYYTHDDPFLTNLVATIVASVISETLARVVKSPATVFLIPAIIPFVPGASLYYTMNYLVLGDTANAVTRGTYTGLIFLGIAIGLSMVTMIFQLIMPVKIKMNLKHKLRFIHKKN
ncbi:MAG: threonine/serine exporter family protein [Clostridia bacterium]|nr:threonine/serine exporter family protein [Clostridia bacterium]